LYFTWLVQSVVAVWHKDHNQSNSQSTLRCFYIQLNTLFIVCLLIMIALGNKICLCHCHRKGVRIGGKEWELVEEVKWYHLDIVRVSSTKRCSSGTVNLDGGWQLFYSGADPNVSAQASVGMLTNPQLSDCVSDWVSLGSWVCIVHIDARSRKSVNMPVAGMCS